MPVSPRSRTRSRRVTCGSVPSRSTNSPLRRKDTDVTPRPPIAHGVRAVEDPFLLSYLSDHQITCDVAPTSNLLLG
ncbi:MAG: hypothetical protein EBY11_04980, partial [Proteobacteria bacterium]|nr:hypothetical protein [Pseudomonadota bacterium]